MEFAAELGVSERMIVRWEKGNVTPRPINQQGLDTILAACSPDVQARFAEMIGLTSPATSAQDPGVSSEQPASPESEPDVPVGDEDQVRHPIDGKLMTLVPAGVYFAGENSEPVYTRRSTSTCSPPQTPTTPGSSRRPTTSRRSTGRTASSPRDSTTTQLCSSPGTTPHAYAQWSAKALPSAQQWEKAARGTRGEIYPWGNQRTPAKVNCREGGKRSTTPVDCYASGVSPYGVYDMCGNTWDWCSTETEPGRYELKGSAFTSPFLRCAPATFNDASADMLDDDTGFRCVTPAETMRALLNVRSSQ
ncbi:hypothetical protein GCM10009736_27920 [Actinomadura bangladeshensis]